MTDQTEQGAEQDQAISWMAVPAHAPVFANDGAEVGRVLEVAALPKEDIFHGIVFQHHGRGTPHLAPAADVSRITEKGVYLSLDRTAADQLEEFHEMHIKRLGLTGIFRWKHTGWKDSSE
ncbi:MAG TPA: hypothetical protein VIN65_03630 [Candidatus Dormibacteraeota bacterium]